jgi:Uncharacterised conserved protein
MASLVNYDSSSDEEDRTDDGGERASSVSSSAAPGSKRPEHMMPSLIYIEIPSTTSSSAGLTRLWGRYEELLVEELTKRGYGNLTSKRLPLPDQYVETPLHISLSRYFELDGKLCDTFIEQLKAVVAKAGRVSGAGSSEGSASPAGIEVSLEACQTFASGEKASASSSAKQEEYKQRVFLGALLGLGRAEVLRLIASVDTVMVAHGFLPYYQPAPEPHCSFLAVDIKGTVDDSAKDKEGGGSATAAGPPAAKRRRLDDTEREGSDEKETERQEETLPLIRTGDIAFSPADLDLSGDDGTAASSASPCFTVTTICARIGKRLFRIPLHGK